MNAAAVERGNLAQLEPVQIGWLAGMFEGEGCITTFGRARHGYDMWQAKIKSTDPDVLIRLRDWTGLGNIHEMKLQPRCKPAQMWVIGSQPQVNAFLSTIYPLLGERRQARAEEFFVSHAGWLARPARPRLTQCGRGHRLPDDRPSNSSCSPCKVITNRERRERLKQEAA